MTKQELVEFLKENLTVGVDFRTYTYGGSNQLEVNIKLDGETICSETCTVEPTQEKGW